MLTSWLGGFVGEFNGYMRLSWAWAFLLEVIGQFLVDKEELALVGLDFFMGRGSVNDCNY